MKKYFNLLFVLLSFSCNTKKMHRSAANDPLIGHYGRAVFGQNNDLLLIGPASYAEFTFTSDSCILFLKNIAPGKDDYNYVAVELDNNYAGRLKIDGNAVKPYTIRSTAHNSSHLLRLYKATESHNGAVALSAVQATGIRSSDHPVRKKIEFIGNSITAGMASDTKEIPCGTGKWYDQHNAYFAYGPRLARKIGADFLLSAVSGIGIYRNWNSNGPTMPEVYESTYLEIDSLRRWDFRQYSPDVVSICLGTNDFSDGDGKTHRLPFDSAIYNRNYIDFIGTIYKHYPSVQIVLLTSPMLSGNKAGLLFACLQTVKARIKELYPSKLPIELYQFKPMIPKGCGYHPDLNDHEILAVELESFFRKFLEK